MVYRSPVREKMCHCPELQYDLVNGVRTLMYMKFFEYCGAKGRDFSLIRYGVVVPVTSNPGCNLFGALLALWVRVHIQYAYN